jgi:ATP-dependent RNA helicase HrpA
MHLPGVGRPGALPRMCGRVPLSPALIDRRRASVPPLRYPESLPIAARRDEVMAAIAEHQVVIVAG